jgi:hypothetical protein
MLPGDAVRTREIIPLTAFWIAIAVAGMALVFFTGWPLYNTYRSRRTGGDYAAKDAAEARAYFRDKAKGDLAQAAADEAGKGPPRHAGHRPAR